MKDYTRDTCSLYKNHSKKGEVVYKPDGADYGYETYLLQTRKPFYLRFTLCQSDSAANCERLLEKLIHFALALVALNRKGSVAMLWPRY
jgi:hypothetical protein